MQSALIATTAFGLEAVVRRELADLGYDGKVIAPGWIGFPGDVAAICRTNLWLRTADRVLVQVATFPADNFDALFETTKALPWHQWLAADACVPVAGRSIKSQLSSVPACQRTVKKAIVESLRTSHQTVELPESGPQYRVEVALHSDQATLTIDTTGPGLHKRGYCPQPSRGRLKETLAAALVLLSFWKRERPLIDPFCGIGTIPIEAALVGRSLPLVCAVPLSPSRGLTFRAGYGTKRGRKHVMPSCLPLTNGLSEPTKTSVRWHWRAIMLSRPVWRIRSTSNSDRFIV